MSFNGANKSVHICTLIRTDGLFFTAASGLEDQADQQQIAALNYKHWDFPRLPQFFFFLHLRCRKPKLFAIRTGKTFSNLIKDSLMESSTTAWGDDGPVGSLHGLVCLMSSSMAHRPAASRHFSLASCPHLLRPDVLFVWLLTAWRFCRTIWVTGVLLI